MLNNDFLLDIKKVVKRAFFLSVDFLWAMKKGQAGNFAGAPLIKRSNTTWMQYTNNLKATAKNAANPIITITYDGSGEAVHPDVYYNPMGWNGHKYWMAFTPYPESNVAFENPSILVSEDGQNWSVPAGLTNPVAIKPESGNNTDPDISVDENNVMWMVYRRSDITDLINIRSSSDGIAWSAESTLFRVAHHNLSPALVYNGTEWIMFTVNGIVKPRSIERRTASSPDGIWSNPKKCTTYNFPPTRQFWHLDVIRDGKRLLMIVCVTPTNDLFLAHSDDWGMSWIFQPVSLLKPTAKGWDNIQIYRSSFIKNTDGNLSLWYSAVSNSKPRAWHIGFTTVTWRQLCK